MKLIATNDNNNAINNNKEIEKPIENDKNAKIEQSDDIPNVDEILEEDAKGEAENEKNKNIFNIDIDLSQLTPEMDEYLNELYKKPFYMDEKEFEETKIDEELINTVSKTLGIELPQDIKFSSKEAEAAYKEIFSKPINDNVGKYTQGIVNEMQNVYKKYKPLYPNYRELFDEYEDAGAEIVDQVNSLNTFSKDQLKDEHEPMQIDLKPFNENMDKLKELREEFDGIYYYYIRFTYTR